MRSMFGIIESSGTAVQDSNGEVLFDELYGGVCIRFGVANPFPQFRQLHFHGRGELCLGRGQDGLCRYRNCSDFRLLSGRGLGHVILNGDNLVHRQQTGFPNHVTIREHPGGFLQGVFVLSFEDNQEIVEMWYGIGLEDVGELCFAKF